MVQDTSALNKRNLFSCACIFVAVRYYYVTLKYPIWSIVFSVNNKQQSRLYLLILLYFWKSTAVFYLFVIYWYLFLPFEVCYKITISWSVIQLEIPKWRYKLMYRYLVTRSVIFGTEKRKLKYDPLRLLYIIHNMDRYVTIRCDYNKRYSDFSFKLSSWMHFECIFKSWPLNC